MTLSPCNMAAIPLILGYMAGQEGIESPYMAAKWALFFSLGVFLSLGLVGVICAFMGRLLGDVGMTFQVLVGAFLVWMGMRMFLQRSCSLPLPYLNRFHIHGGRGALILGGAYGVIAGPCTFGFLAPILALVGMERDVSWGIGMTVSFAMGYSLPILVAAFFIAKVKLAISSSKASIAGAVFQKGAGALISLLGLYFALNPILSALGFIGSQ